MKTTFGRSTKPGQCFAGMRGHSSLSLRRCGPALPPESTDSPLDNHQSNQHLPEFVVRENEAILTENHHECSQYASKKVSKTWTDVTKQRSALRCPSSWNDTKRSLTNQVRFGNAWIRGSNAIQSFFLRRLKRDIRCTTRVYRPKCQTSAYSVSGESV
jgi:hypothetical protein